MPATTPSPVGKENEGATWGLIFDLDGVLTDTEEQHFLSWQQVAREHGIPFDRGVAASLRGRSREDALRLLLGGRQPGVDEALLLTAKNAYYLEAIGRLGPADLAEGAGELLSGAERAGVPLGLASSSRNARLVCTRLGIIDRFRAFADGCSGLRAKPEADSFLWVAGRLGLPPGRCTVIEDSAAGLRAAVSAGFPTVAVGTAGSDLAVGRRVHSLTQLTIEDLEPGRLAAHALSPTEAET